MKNILYLVLVILLGTLLLFGTAASALGYFPWVTKTIGLGAPRDLGVTYTEEEYLSALTKLETALQTQTLEATFSGPELTALFQGCSGSMCVLQNAQVKTHANGTLAISGTVDRDRLSDFVSELSNGATGDPAVNTFLQFLPAQPPLYVVASLVGESDTVIVSLETVRLGGLSIAGEGQASLEAELNKLLNDYLMSLPGTQVQAASIDEAGLYLDIDLLPQILQN